MRLFSRRGGDPLARKRLFCIIHEFFIRFVHHPPGSRVHTRISISTHTHIHTQTTHINIHKYAHEARCIPDRGHRLAPPIYVQALCVISTRTRTHTHTYIRTYKHLYMCTIHYTRRFVNMFIISGRFGGKTNGLYATHRTRSCTINICIEIRL